MSWGPRRLVVCATRTSSKSLLPNDGPVYSQWFVCKLHDVLHMFSMALTACPERGRHTNKITGKFGEDSGKTV